MCGTPAAVERFGEHCGPGENCLVVGHTGPGADVTSMTEVNTESWCGPFLLPPGLTDFRRMLHGYSHESEEMDWQPLLHLPGKGPSFRRSVAMDIGRFEEQSEEATPCSILMKGR